MFRRVLVLRHQTGPGLASTPASDALHAAVSAVVSQSWSGIDVECLAVDPDGACFRNALLDDGVVAFFVPAEMRPRCPA